MSRSKALVGVHPRDEQDQPGGRESSTVETFVGKVGLRWDEEASVTVFG